jgi:threonine/homoserine/homoserine lactone efflux protein
METPKVLCYTAMIVSGLIALIFLLDAGLGIFNRMSLALDIMFILGAAFVIWQGYETTRELR